jgi:pyruvate dehydrogenase phosphatase
MNLRRLSVALASGLVGYGSYYVYKQPGAQQSLANTSPYSTSTDAAVNDPTQMRGRKAVVVSGDSIYTGSIEGNEPISKYTDDSGRKVLEMLTPEQATQKLRRNEESYFVRRGQGVVRYDVVQIPSNDPIEDDHSEKIVEVPYAAATAEKEPTSDWMFWGVYDGHSGWTTSAKLRQTLINYVARELNNTYKSGNGTPAADAVAAAMKTGFNRLDYEICHESVEKVLKSKSKLVASEVLAPALSGACALLSFYDSQSKLLHVACTGDSRAVLGRRQANGKWIATPLSVDQTGSNPEEAARLRAEHPGEPNVVARGRILGGLEPSRAFGDAVYKWSRETSEHLRKNFLGRTPSSLLKTPPYVTAEPIVTSTQIQPENGDFLVMATDGLWEMLTNEEVVGLVGQWVEKQQALASGKGNGGWLDVFKKGKGLPVEHTATSKGEDGQKTPIRQQQWGVEGKENERFVVEDRNAATHLVRNALGGKNNEMLCALLTLPSPFSRRYR